MPNQLRQIYEEFAELFDLLGVERTSNWGDELSEAFRLLQEVLSASVKSSVLVLRELQNPRTRVEAQLTLKYDLEQRGERHDDTMMGLMKSMLDTLILGSSTMKAQLPAWFLPLHEVDFEAKRFACEKLATLRRGYWGDDTNVVIKFFSVPEGVWEDLELPLVGTEPQSSWPRLHWGIFLSTLGQWMK